MLALIYAPIIPRAFILLLRGGHDALASWVYQHSESFSAYNNLELKAGDALLVYGRKAPLDPRIIFLAIDSQSTELELMSDERERLLRDSPALNLMAQGFPFNRRVYAMVVERLAQAGAKVVAFDMLFPKDKDNDAEVRSVWQWYRAQLVVGSNLQTLVDENGSPHPVLEQPTTTLIPFEMEAECVGFVNFKPDVDGSVRRGWFRSSELELKGQDPEPGRPEVLSLAARAATKAGFDAAIPATHETTMFRFVEDVRPRSLYEIFVPALWDGKNYRGGALFKDKIVFIGPFGNFLKGEQDTLPTPLGQTLGPQIHLSALNAILTNDFLSTPPIWAELLIVAAAGVLAWLAGLAVHGPLARTALLLVITGAYIGLAFVIYNSAGLCLSLLNPTLALLSSGFVGLVWERVHEQMEKTRVRQTLERYVSRDVVTEVLDNPQSFLHTAGGERRPLTILFSDVRGFTTITESADPAQLVAQLNEYFTDMVRIVFAHRGTLDKFIGDAVMAHWGAIMSRGEGPDACRAVAAALDMLKALERLNVAWKARGMLELRIGVGVNHGHAICANIGSEEKFEFTAIGDPVNLASRLEGATKQFQQDLLIGEEVAPLVRQDFVVRSVDLMQVSGKTKPVEVFTVLSNRQSAEPAWLARYEEGIRLFRGRGFVEAEAAFSEVLATAPGDWLAEEYLRRCRAYRETPPPEDWNGVSVLRSK